MTAPLPPPKMFCCNVCGHEIAPLAKNGQALLLTGGLITGRTPVTCTNCGQVRTWKPRRNGPRA